MVRSPDWQTKDGSVQLYCADCLDVLPDLPPGLVETVVSSPPYNTLPKSHKPSGLHAERMSGVNQWITKAANGYSDDMPEDEYQKWLVDVFGACRRVCKGLVWVNHKIRYRDGEAIHPVRIFPWPIYSEVIWDRSVSMALNCKRYAPSTEHLLGFGRPCVWNDLNNSLMSVWRIPFDRDDTSDHPCPFPIELASRPIASSTSVGGIVLDVFCGSGTTGVAAVRLGRRFIGIEKERRFFDGAVDRLTRELTRFPLFESKPEVQRSLNL